MITIDCRCDEWKLRPIMPEDYHGPMVPGAEFVSASNKIGKIVIQKFREESFSFYYSILRFTEKIGIQCKQIHEGLHARFLLRKGEYTLYDNKVRDYKTVYEKNTDHPVLDIIYSHQVLQEINLIFRSADENNQLQLKIKKSRPIKPSMQDIIHELLYCPFDKSTARFYLDIKLKEFLFVIMEDIFHLPQKEIKLSAHEKSCIQKVRELLIENISGPAFSLRELAKKYHVNELRLRKGFDQFYGKGFTEYLFEVRMQRAVELLVTTDLPIKAICTQVGYPRITHFITAFRRRFGYTPGSVRRR